MDTLQLFDKLADWPPMIEQNTTEIYTLGEMIWLKNKPAQSAYLDRTVNCIEVAYDKSVANASEMGLSKRTEWRRFLAWIID